MIGFENVSKYYPTRNGRSYVFREINAEIPTDKSIGILGPNGAGKSTLIRMIGGADMPSAGRIYSDVNISWPLGLQGGVQGNMSGRENARFVARIHGYRDTREIEERVADFAEIGKYFDEPMKNYSSGMRSRVTFGITMAFDFNFDVLLIDELTAVGDAAFKKKSEQVLKQKYASSTLIMVNHSVDQLRQFCDAGLVVYDKNIRYFDDISDAVNEYKRLYGV
ncbi:ABC transporter ATP-binding protein [Parathalassolituus penaei]|uniref:ABC transporter ATP-binding protein n=1 Tax=Parathalassolituus penaei TaxID=2997323 RepID=A0A9X3ISW0_9GAMM|nr:ABC transporter ATP-binding protein [Parathalassolituus penaei]MCY0966832.1 ABC transporter ATP-binding protein [Parathalassolituus penaei]